MQTLEHLLAGLPTFKCLWVLVARHPLFVLTLWYGLLNLHRALLGAFLLAVIWAPVFKVTENLLTLFEALVLLVVGVIRVTDTCANMATFQTELTRFCAASFRGFVEICSAGDSDLPVWMVLTAEGESRPHLALASQSVEDVTPQFDFAQHCTVANAVEAFLGTRQGNTNAVGDVQEADLTLWIAADQR